MAARLSGLKRQLSLMGKKDSRCDQSKPIMMILPGSQTTTFNLAISLDSYKRRKPPLDQDEDPQLCSQPLKVILALKPRAAIHCTKPTWIGLWF